MNSGVIIACIIVFVIVFGIIVPFRELSYESVDEEEETTERNDSQRTTIVTNPIQ